MMDQKYLTEIKARCNEGRPTARIDVKALIAEVERLTAENAALENDKINAEMNLENLTAEVEGLNAENATLKKALELRCRYHRLDDFSVESEMQFFIQQAQEGQK